MPDLSEVLLPWEEAAEAPTVQRAIGAMAILHTHPWPAVALADGPWCPLRERVLLLSRPAAEGYRADGNPVGERFLTGWDAFAAAVPAPARDLIAGLARDPSPLLAALARLPATLIHGDLKLANLGIAPDERIALIDWQMVTVAPVAVELGWFLVSNAPSLPVRPAGRPGPLPGGRHGRRRRERRRSGTQVDLAILVGLLLRGWRKGIDTAAQARYPSGERAADDLAWWAERAVEAAGRRL